MGDCAITAEAFERMVAENMPVDEAFRFEVLDLSRGRAHLQLRFHERQLRPGGSIAGPVLFTLADTALWAAALTILGLQPLAVTADMQIRFLRRPGPHDVVADARLLKTEGRLLVGEVTLYSEGQQNPVAHVTGTYVGPKPKPR